METYIRLVRARIDTEGDSAAYAAARDRALAEAGVTARQMREFVEAGRRDPDELRDAWQAIAARLDTLYGGVTTEPPPELRGTIGPPGRPPGNAIPRPAGAGPRTGNASGARGSRTGATPGAAPGAATPHPAIAPGASRETPAPRPGPRRAAPGAAAPPAARVPPSTTPPPASADSAARKAR